MTITHAMILAAGRGERMRPITDRIPKPMVEVAGRSLIDRALDQVEQYGIGQAVVNISYKAEMLERHLSSRTRPSIALSHEPQALETGGGMRHALPLLGEGAFFSLNSDTVCIDRGMPALAHMEQVFAGAELDIVMLLHPVGRAIGYNGPGDFFLEAGGRLRRRGNHANAPYVFTGIQIVHPRVFTDCPQGPFSMNFIYDRGAEDGFLSPRVAGVVHEGDWLHVGDAAGLEQAEAYFSSFTDRLTLSPTGN